MDNQLDEFKQFVRKYPGLRYDVRSGKATWQSIYEEWYLYGEEDSQWEKYKVIPDESTTANAPATNTSSTTGKTTDEKSISNMSGAEMMTQAFQYLQKMDMNKVQQTVGTVQKFVQLFQSFQGGAGGAGGAAGAGLGAAASQRQSYPGLFSKFDD